MHKQMFHKTLAWTLYKRFLIVFTRIFSYLTELIGLTVPVKRKKVNQVAVEAETSKPKSANFAYMVSF